MSVKRDADQHRVYVSGLDEDKELEIATEGLRDSVYIEKCTKGVIRVTGKFNALTINNCKGVGIVFDTAVAIAEVVNSQKIQLQVTGSCPTIVVDKSFQVVIYASETVKKESRVVTSSSVGVNFMVPEGDDMKEYYIPEQIVSQIIDGKFVSKVNEEK
jgi:adenylyl cyclase-associated protein